MTALMDTRAANYNPAIDVLRGLIGAAVGGAVGYFAFGWLVSQGFYAVALPGVLLGIGLGLQREHQPSGLPAAWSVQTRVRPLPR